MLQAVAACSLPGVFVLYLYRRGGKKGSTILYARSRDGFPYGVMPCPESALRENIRLLHMDRAKGHAGKGGSAVGNAWQAGSGTPVAEVCLCGAVLLPGRPPAEAIFA